MVEASVARCYSNPTIKFDGTDRLEEVTEIDECKYDFYEIVIEQLPTLNEKSRQGGKCRKYGKCGKCCTG